MKTNVKNSFKWLLFIFVTVCFITAIFSKPKPAQAVELKKYLLECYKQNGSILGSWVVVGKPTFSSGGQTIFSHQGKYYHFINTQCTLVGNA